MIEVPAWLIELWELAKLAGPFGTALMGLLWYLERGERKAAQQHQLELVEVLERNNGILSTWSAATESRNVAFNSVANAVNEMVTQLKFLEKAIERRP